MGPSRIWLGTLLVTCLLLHHYAVNVDAQIARTMRHWRHREKGVCSGSNNKLSQGHTADRYADLRSIYENCTRVFGNVEITWLDRATIANRSMDFLDSIEEIKGYLLIFRTDLEELSLKNLKIIWGDDQSANAAIHIEHNMDLKVLSMPNLRSVDKGFLWLRNSSNTCYLQQNVNSDELFNFNRSLFRTYETEKSLRKQCAKKSIPCHPSCNGACWGPGADQCQILYRTVCPSECESNQCYFDVETNQKKCCDAQCVGGCNGPTSRDCVFCTNFMQCKSPHVECRCVEQCTSMRKYNKKTGQVEINPDGYYSLDNRHCEKECPVERLMQDDVCVEHCGPGFHYDPNKRDKQCRKCDGPCPKSCKFEKGLSARNVHELQNCTEIEGYIHLTTEAFEDHIEPPGETKVRGMTMDDLLALSSVRFVSEFVYVAGSRVRSLSFLENLEIIEGRTLFNGRQALVVSLNDHMEYLGLRKLKRIEKGDVIISSNTDLCYTDSFSWTDMVTGANNTIKIDKNRDTDVCIMEERVCNAMCDPAFGCWGSSAADCRKCTLWLQDGRCVDKCAAKYYFPNPAKMECESCDRSCDTCKGPAATDCLTCRGLKLYRKPGASSVEFDDDESVEEPKLVSHLLKTDDSDTTMGPENTPAPSEVAASQTQLTCVPECPNSRFYVQDGECKRCHRACYDLGCDGPSNSLGNNGCNVCKYALVKKPENGSNTSIERCLYNSDKQHSHTVCQNNDLVNHFVQVPSHGGVEEFECAPCDDECFSCTSKGTSRLVNKCKCKNYVAIGSSPFRKNGQTEAMREDERCVAKCSNFMYFDNTTVDAAAEGVCRMCSQACHRGDPNKEEKTQPHCTGGTEYDCANCAPDYYSLTKGGTKKCVKNCTAESQFPYKREMSCNLADYETRDRIHKAALYIAIALFLVIVLIIGFCLYRRQRRLSKELEQEKVANNPEMPELIPMDFNGPKINREKFLLISGHELSRGAKELGRGAFGVVYAGCWMPPLGNKGKPTKVPVAIKVVRDPSGKAQSEMLDEALKMTMLRHENLLRIVGVCLSGEDLQLVTLLRPLGNLREFLQKHKGKLSGKELLAYSYQIASGMKYLTDHRVVHRDLAARNVLVKNIQHVEITDFGLAKLIDIGSDSVQVGEGKVAIKWLALEALEKQVYNTATDVWAFGVTVWEILTYGESPYANMTPMAIKDFLLQGQRLAQPNNCSTELYKILIDCWLPNPESRPTFAVIKDILYRYCRAPYVFVIDHDQNAAIDMDDNCSQRGLIEEILQETDFEDPQNYFDSEPNTPGCHNMGDVFNPTGVRRMDSLGSQRYAQDPTTRPKEFGMADDNYLVPNSHAAEMGATMYTPVVVDESGNSSLVESLGYYNEVKPGAEYINDTQALTKKSIRNSRDDRLSTMIEEEEDFAMEKESCL